MRYNLELVVRRPFEHQLNVFRHIPFETASHERWRVSKRLQFRKKLKYMFELDRPPAPDAPSGGTHTSVSSVLAQTFTEPFIVYSAKRFPGVPGNELIDRFRFRITINGNITIM